MIHFVPEPCMIKINDIQFALTSTDVIKDLTMTATTKSSFTDKIARNFVHLMRQKSFYPLYPPPDNICIDYEAWNQHARINKPPRIFVASSDLATFNKEVNNCNCINPGRLVKGTSTGTYAQLIISASPITAVPAATAPVATQAQTQTQTAAPTQTQASKAADDPLAILELYKTKTPSTPIQTVEQDAHMQTQSALTQLNHSTTQQTTQNVTTTMAEKDFYVSVTFHKI